METLDVFLKTEEVEFHPFGTVFWKAKKILLIADVHLGKVGHFRKYGSAIPANSIQKNFEKLTEVIKKDHPEKIIFLGDLFHSTLNYEWKLFQQWVKKQTAEIILIEGNHDIISPLNYQELGIKTQKELILNNFLLTHHPEEREGYFTICGHLHPGFKLLGRGKQVLKLRCFYKTENQLVLPAFGEFTGNYWVQPEPQDKIFVCTPTEVIAIN
ncbi:ligase-associated DNA damage response endonuclease PdeM [Mesonia maritima]|uniref:DNA ligase-associated metallophosphoesterase n=1 Tax=Mesonia maritima TaxID=1793873 RepID=A0ABU1K1Z5_9FLAO|nr:ligase-associated DNA damage response endonuclease PdeM [Mesonia maritima]MDR6299625.1 DNA ligase-associated metallophosphoesterase [Mesonia maritima]